VYNNSHNDAYFEIGKSDNEYATEHETHSARNTGRQIGREQNTRTRYKKNVNAFFIFQNYTWFFFEKPYVSSFPKPDMILSFRPDMQFLLFSNRT